MNLKSKLLLLDGVGHVEKGTIFYISYFAMHRLKENWGDDADDFNPEHFSVENVAKRSANAYMPFSVGPRNCIGQHFATVSIKAFVFHLLLGYKFSTTATYKDLQPTFGISLKMENEVPLMITASPKNI